MPYEYEYPPGVIFGGQASEPAKPSNFRMLLRYASKFVGKIDFDCRG